MIIPMKKARIVVLKEEQAKLLQALQQQSLIMPIATDNAPPSFSLDDPFIQRAEKTLYVLKDYREKKKIGTQFKVSYDEFMEQKDERRELVEQIEQLDEQNRHLIEQIKALKQEVNNLGVWLGLEGTFQSMSNLKYVITHCGLIPKYNRDKVSALLENHQVEYMFLGQDARNQALVIYSYYEDDSPLMEELKALTFNEVFFPKEDLTIEQLIEVKQTQMKTMKLDLEANESSLHTLGAKSEEVQLLIDQIATQEALRKAPVTSTLETAYLEGWVKETDVERLKQLLQATIEVYDAEIVDPEDDEIPPTAVKNNWFTQIFEPITNTFSVPSTNELDPNPVMAPWYWLLFGMMMGDVGYGAIMLVGVWLAIRLLKPKGGTRSLMMMLMISGISTIIWGVLFGSYFGITFMPILVEPMNDPMKMLLISMAVGAFHILSGLFMKGYQFVLKKQYLDAIADSLSWILVIVGIGVYVVGMSNPIISTVGMISAITGAGIVLLTAGRANKNIFGRIAKGFTGLYAITGYVSDIISYSRILALGLSTASISFVMNLLAGMIKGPMSYIAGPIILIFGHTLNLVMSLLSAYVHTSRLQYIEFFGKFYEGNGYLFRPLSLKLKHVDEVHEKA